MVNREISTIPAQEGEHKILGSINILVEGKDGLRSQNVLLVENNQEGAEHPFRAINPLTEEEVKLTDTRLYDAYVATNIPLPSNLNKGVGEHYRIRVDKKKKLVRKAQALSRTKNPQQK